MAAPSLQGSNQTSGNGITTLALNGGSLAGNLAVGDLVVVDVLSSSYTAASPTITNGVNNWDLDQNVQASGANQRAITFSRVLTLSDFFGSAALGISGWATSGTMRVLVRGYRHANGFSSTASLRRWAYAPYNTASGGSGDYTVASLSDCPNACIVVTSIGGGATGVLTIKYDGGSAVAPTWDESVLTTGNQSSHNLYDAGVSGPTTVVYTANGNNNKAISTVVYTANPDTKHVTGKGSGIATGKATAYRQELTTHVSGKGSSIAAAKAHLFNPNSLKRSPGKGSTAGVGGGELVVIKRPVVKGGAVAAAKAAGVTALRRFRGKGSSAAAAKGGLYRYHSISAKSSAVAGATGALSKISPIGGTGSATAAGKADLYLIISGEVTPVEGKGSAVGGGSGRLSRGFSISGAGGAVAASFAVSAIVRSLAAKGVAVAAGTAVLGRSLLVSDSAEGIDESFLYAWITKTGTDVCMVVDSADAAFAPTRTRTLVRSNAKQAVVKTRDAKRIG